MAPVGDGFAVVATMATNNRGRLQSNWVGTAVDVQDIASTFHTSVDTLPPIDYNRTLDWGYGNVREVNVIAAYRFT